MLYFWPPAPLQGAHMIVSECAVPLINLRHVSHLRIEGLTLEGGRASGIVINGGTGVTVAACRIRNCGNRGVAVHYGFDHAVTHCEISGVRPTRLSVAG